MALELWRPRGGLARSSFRGLAREMDDLFDRFFRDWPWSRFTGEGRGWAPAVDMVDRPDEIVVRADVPGLSEKDIDVTVDSGILTIRGERKDEWEAKEDDYYASERWVGSFSRSLSLPSGVDPDRIKATLKHGVLEVRIPKTKQAAGKRVEIKAA